MEIILRQNVWAYGFEAMLWEGDVCLSLNTVLEDNYRWMSNNIALKGNFFCSCESKWLTGIPFFEISPVLSESAVAGSRKTGCNVTTWGICAPSIYLH